jgi:DNA-binding protein YbaB
MVQDMLVSALNDVNKKIEAETQKLMGGFNGMGLF